jgi:hypothetical protein
LWHWHAIPNTQLSSVDPTPRPLGNTGPSSKIDTWCGATLKRSGSVYMLGAAGGHADYAGNEVNALALNVDTPRWVQLRAPTPNSQIINGTQFYVDLRPSSTHTYYATQFIDSLNRMVVFASPGVQGPFPSAPGGFAYTGEKRSFSFNVGAGDWDSPDYIARFPGSGDFTACLCVKHQSTGDVYYSRNYGDGWYKWTAATNSWSKLSNTSRAPWYAGVALDPRRNRILTVGGYNANGPEVYNLSGTKQSVTFGGLGGSVLAADQYPGALYDEVLDRFLVFRNSGGSIRVYMVTPDTWSVSQPAMTGTAPSSRTNGIQNAAQYVPELRGFVLANKHNGNVYFMRTST